MKILLVALLTAGTNAHNVSFQAKWKYGSALGCIVPWVNIFMEYNYYGCYCLYDHWKYRKEELDRCCSSRQNCYMEVFNLEKCKYLRDNYEKLSYFYSCTGKEVTCIDLNDYCEDFLCKCDQQAAICFSKDLYNDDYDGNYC